MADLSKVCGNRLPLWCAADMANMKISSRKKAPRSGFVLGQKAFEKISAVEGIRLTAEMRRDLKRLDDSRLGAEAERRFLIQKYGRSA